jgi:hypothetical protein
MAPRSDIKRSCLSNEPRNTRFSSHNRVHRRIITHNPSKPIYKASSPVAIINGLIGAFNGVLAHTPIMTVGQRAALECPYTKIADWDWFWRMGTRLTTIRQTPEIGGRPPIFVTSGQFCCVRVVYGSQESCTSDAFSTNAPSETRTKKIVTTRILPQVSMWLTSLFSLADHLNSMVPLPFV